MSTIYHNHPNYIHSTGDHLPVKNRVTNSSSSSRLPLRPRQMNVENVPPSSSILKGTGKASESRVTKVASSNVSPNAAPIAMKGNDMVENGFTTGCSNGKGSSELSSGYQAAGVIRAPPSTIADHHESKRSESCEVRIEELRRKPNGEGHTVHHYIRGKLLGKGGFAKVYLCTSLDTNRTYAVKIVPKANLVKTRARQKLQAEIKIHRTLKHKHICEYKHFFEDKTNCYILLELCHNQSMNELIKRRKRLTEPEVKYFLSQLLDSVCYMHNVNVIHRDLKLGNLFLDKHLRIKVGDLGLATRLASSDEKRKTICGTPNYIAPEVIDGDKEKRGHSFEVDIWSMGVICYTLLVGKPPYESKDVKSTYQRILANQYSFPSHIPISEHARDLISRMLQTRPSKRPSLEDIGSHPFFVHDVSKIPKSLPLCCTHVAPDWQEDEDGNLVPMLAEAEDKHLRSKASSRKTKELRTDSDSRARSSPVTHRLPLSSQDTNRVQVKQYKREYERENDVNKHNDDERKSTRNIQCNEKVPVYNSTKYVGNDGLESHSKPPQSRIPPNAREIADDPKRKHRENSNQIQRKVREDECISEVSKKISTFTLRDPGSNEATREVSENIDFSQNTGREDGEKLSSNKDNDLKAMDAMHSRLTEIFNSVESKGGPKNFKPCSPTDVLGARKWVTRYVDYTSKYGLGFMLNDKSAGVYFNDSTKAVLAPDGDSFIYVERKKINENDSGGQDQVSEAYTLTSYPETLQKKVTLLKHFRNYLIEQQKRDEDDNDAQSDKEDIDTENNVYLKKWVRTKHAILFRLSNSTVQVVFYDHTEILLSSEGRLVTYLDKRQGRATYHVEEILMGIAHADIKKRLKYARDILYQLISGAKN